MWWQTSKVTIKLFSETNKEIFFYGVVENDYESTCHPSPKLSRTLEYKVSFEMRL